MEAGDDLKINDEVIKSIVGRCCMEVPGVSSLSGGSLYQNLVKWGGQSDTRGIGIEKTEDENIERVDVRVNVERGQPVPRIAKNLQMSIKETVESMTGKEVNQIFVYIDDIREKIQGPGPEAKLADSEEEEEVPEKNII